MVPMNEDDNDVSMNTPSGEDLNPPKIPLCSLESLV